MCALRVVVRACPCKGFRIRQERDEAVLHGLKHPHVMRYAWEVLRGVREDVECNFTWTMLGSHNPAALAKAGRPFFVDPSGKLNMSRRAPAS